MGEGGVAKRQISRETEQVPFHSYALDRAATPRFHIRVVENTQRLYPAHRHDYFQIIYFMTEAPAMRIGFTAYKPKAGSIYFMAPMVAHQIRFAVDTRCVVIYFDLDFLRPNLTRAYPIQELARLAPELSPFAWQDRIDFRLEGEALDRCERAIATMLRQNLEARLCASEMIRSDLLALLAGITQDHEAEIASLSSRTPVHARDAAHLRRIATFISENYATAPSLAEAVKAVGLSKSRLCALLRRHAGAGFNELVREMRIEEACALLTLSDKSVGEIAGAVGYVDDKYFLRSFKQVVGMTPGGYRRSRAALQADLRDVAPEQAAHG